MFFSDKTMDIWGSQPNGTFGLGSKLFTAWPAGYLVKHLQLVVISAALIQLCTHVCTLWATLSLKQRHEEHRALRVAAPQAQANVALAV